MPPLAVVVILALATYRLTRLCTSDTISAPAREAIFRWAYTDDLRALEAWRVLHPEAQEIPSHVPRGWEFRTWVYDLVTCDQCLGVWWGVAVYITWRVRGDTALAVLTVAALLGAQSLFARIADALARSSEK